MSKRVWIDAGHGGSDTGANAFGLCEKEINLVMALSCKEELESQGIVVGMTRTKDAYEILSTRCDKANKWKADYFISIHNNAGGGDGLEVIHSIMNGEGKELAQRVANAVSKETGQNVRRVFAKEGKSGDYYAVIRNTNMPAIIFEGAFLDNDKDNDAIDTVAEQKAFGKAIAHGIMDHLGISYSKQTIPTTPATPVGGKVVYTVQLGAFSDRSNAARLAETLKSQGHSVYIVKKEV